MKIAVMQPYFFPYVGYFKLIKAVDIFVYFNDVQYIRRGWVNRNRIRSNEKGWQYLTVPVKNCARETNINAILIDNSKEWHEHHVKTLRFHYKPNPVLEMYSNMGQKVFLQDLLMETLEKTCSILGFNTRFVKSSDIPNPDNLRREFRIIDICKRLGAAAYLNLPGGRELYDSEDFQKEGIELNFIEHEKANLLSMLDYASNKEEFDALRL